MENKQHQELINSIEELAATIEANGPHSNDSMIGHNLIDGIFEIAYQLKRIADQLEKK